MRHWKTSPLRICIMDVTAKFLNGVSRLNKKQCFYEGSKNVLGDLLKLQERFIWALKLSLSFWPHWSKTIWRHTTIIDRFLKSLDNRSPGWSLFPDDFNSWCMNNVSHTESPFIFSYIITWQKNNYNKIQRAYVIALKRSFFIWLRLSLGVGRCFL